MSRDIRHDSIRDRGQAMTGERIVEVYGDLIRAEVQRDSYDHQSYARFKVFTPQGWELLGTVDPKDLEVYELASSYAGHLRNGEDWRGAVSASLDDLIERAIVVLKGKRSWQ